MQGPSGKLNTRIHPSIDPLPEHNNADAMQKMGHELQKQGLRLEQIDQKVDDVNTRLEQTTEQLVEISKKLMSNKTVLAFILGAVASAIAVLVLVP